MSSTLTSGTKFRMNSAKIFSHHFRLASPVGDSQRVRIPAYDTHPVKNKRRCDVMVACYKKVILSEYIQQILIPLSMEMIGFDSRQRRQLYSHK